jgi:HK97 gp10 family phage protein
MGASIKVSGATQADIKKLMTDLRFVDKDAAKEARRALLVLAKKVAQDAQARAPKRTGKTASKTRARVNSNGDAMITNNSPAARPNEFGGRHPLFGNMDKWYEMRRQPFMFPAVDAHAEEFYREAEKVIDTVFAKIGFK